jgi:GT2 family glycosyltransferase
MSDSAPLIYVVTLNWNRCEDTLAFLGSCAQARYPRLRLLVVDNGSTDGSVEAIAAHFPQVEQLVNERNLGFAAGMNVGIRYALAQGADYLFVANNDTFLAPDALGHLVEAATQHGAELLAPAIYHSVPHERLWSLGGWQRRTLLEITQCREIAPEPFEVDFVTACGVLIHRRCLERVGLFDERFFMYYEDADYCLRARQAGCKLLVVPRARMWHKVATSSGGSDSPAERYHMALSSVQFFRKHVRGWRWLAVVPYRTGSAVKTVGRLLGRQRWDAARAYLRGLWAGARK